MRMAFHTDYALRMLIYLVLQPGGACTVNDVAEAYGLSRNHLVKVAQTLRDAGVVETTRGRMGGIRLIKAPDQINLGALARITEGDFALVQCMRGRGDAGCVIAPACRLKGVLTQALDAYLAVLDAHTLADLTANRTELAALFRMETQAA